MVRAREGADELRDEEIERLLNTARAEDEVTLLEGMGVSDPLHGRLIDIAVRAAFGTGAEVRLVPGPTVSDGLAALLRG